MTKDPVCAMTIDPAQAAARTEYEGKSYYFCSPQCQRTFRANPQKYAAPSSHRNAAAAQGDDK